MLTLTDKELRGAAAELRRARDGAHAVCITPAVAHLLRREVVEPACATLVRRLALDRHFNLAEVS